MGRDRGKKGGSGRDEGGFIALPWSVVDSLAYQRLSMHARALLLEVARQFVKDNNGRLLLSRAHMATRGWKSADMLTKAKAELLAGGFIHQTVMGHRPNKASWYAVTWQALDRLAGYDAGALESFKRGAYREADPLPKPKPTREALYRKWDTSRKNAALKPLHGTEGYPIGPHHGTESAPPVPPHGPIKVGFAPSSVPPRGHHLEKPSPVGNVSALFARQRPHETTAQLWRAIGGDPSRLWHIGMRGPVAGVQGVFSDQHARACEAQAC